MPGKQKIIVSELLARALLTKSLQLKDDKQYSEASALAVAANSMVSTMENAERADCLLETHC